MADFDEIFRDADSYFKKLSERMFKEMEEIEKAIRSGKLQGEWEVKPIEEPGVKGYVARGRFQLGEPLTFPKQAKDEVREPLTDVFEEQDHVKLYVELPGVEKNDIQLNVTEGRAEVKAKNFYKVIDLPTRDVEFDKVIANYKNGVLEVMIPKTKKTASEEKKKTIKIE
jgi:HSP20 family protein